MNLQRLVLVALLAALASCAAPVTKRHAIDETAMTREAEQQRAIALQTHSNRQERVDNVAYPIMVANTDFCGEKVRYSYGFNPIVADAFPAEYKNAAIQQLGATTQPSILYVIKNSPAWQAGIKPKDVILSVNSKPTPKGKKAIEKLDEMLKASPQTMSLRMKRPGAGEYDVNLQAIQICDYPVKLADSGDINAFADGKSIHFTTGMMRFAENDEELAVIMGHELAHNIMGHIDKKQTNAMGGLIVDVLIAATLGVDTQGAFTNAAASAYSQDFESESDYVGLYLTSRAGYSVDKAAYFWRRMAAEHPGNIKTNHTATHPPTPERFLALEKTVAEIDRKRNSRIALIPELDENAKISASNASGAIASLQSTSTTAPAAPIPQSAAVSNSAPTQRQNTSTGLAASPKPTSSSPQPQAQVSKRNNGNFYDDARNMALEKNCSSSVEYLGRSGARDDVYETRCGSLTKYIRCSENKGCTL